MTEDTVLPDSLDLETGRELVSIARDTVESCATNTGTPNIDTGRGRDGVLSRSFGTFVTLERTDQLRGCCGCLETDKPLGKAVQDMAVDAARHDPRFPPVGPDEVPEITVTVTVLSEPKDLDVPTPDAYPKAIDIGRDGLIATDGHRHGVLLPQVPIENNWNSAKFLTAVCRKAGLSGNEWRRDAVDIKRFTARWFEEQAPDGDIDIRYADTHRQTAGSEKIV